MLRCFFIRGGLKGVFAYLSQRDNSAIGTEDGSSKGCRLLLCLYVELKCFTDIELYVIFYIPFHFLTIWRRIIGRYNADGYAFTRKKKKRGGDPVLPAFFLYLVSL